MFQDVAHIQHPRSNPIRRFLVTVLCLAALSAGPAHILHHLSEPACDSEEGPAPRHCPECVFFHHFLTSDIESPPALPHLQVGRWIEAEPVLLEQAPTRIASTARAPPTALS